MSIEEYEGSAVRGLLGTALAGSEPPLRDLASGSIARGDAARRRNRVFAAGGAALSVVAVIGTFAAVTGATPAKRASQNPAQQVTSAATSTSLSGNLAFGPTIGGLGKVIDVRKHLAALLQPLLPAGITARTAPDVVPEDNRPTVILTGSTGTNQVTMWVGTAPADDSHIREAVCTQGGNCQTKAVAGGTVYVDEHSATAADLVRGAGFPADVVRPGTGKTVVNRTLSMTFVPTDRSRYAFNFTATTATADTQYVEREPSDYMTGGVWPPQMVSTLHAFDASGWLMSAEDFVTMLSKPGLDKVENLLDPRTAVSKETQSQLADTAAQITAAVQPTLPAGVTASVDLNSVPVQMVVTGPTAKNVLRWEIADQTAQYRQQTLGQCPPNVSCSKQMVPGGTLLVWDEKPMDSNGTILEQRPSAYKYWFFPADTSKPALTMTLDLNAARTGAPGRSIPDPGHTYSVSDGPYVPVQVSAEQFLAVAEDGQLAAAISKTTPLLATLY